MFMVNNNKTLMHEREPLNFLMKFNRDKNMD